MMVQKAKGEDKSFKQKQEEKKKQAQKQWSMIRII
jgi:hypothetical protein